ncbi:hypothetical protein C8R43DRAFT_189230 [Mycena crocata]|nr:hypothetical protein C8R43DRAFT_189230 [Mycena crocata]
MSTWRHTNSVPPTIPPNAPKPWVMQRTFQPMQGGTLIHADLVSATKQLEDLSAQVVDLNVQIEGLNAQIEGHPANAASRVPHDLLQEIFLACLPASYSDTSLDPPGAPLLLCHICGTWRAVALAFPRLWTSLHINTSHVLRNQQRVAAVEQWLQRSVPFPPAFPSLFGRRRVSLPLSI